MALFNRDFGSNKCLLATLIMVAFIAGVAWADRGPAGVANGVHNLSATGVKPGLIQDFPGDKVPSFYASDEDQICVFCHTPHGGSLTGPLWNRSNPTTTWQHYNSATLSSEITDDARQLSDESMLCMSCHDGGISVYHMLNTPNDRTTAIQNLTFPVTDVYVNDMFGPTSARIGGSPSDTSTTGDLRDDHPISFSYTKVQGSVPYQSGGKAGELRDWTDAEDRGARFFDGGPNGEKRVECSSCHDPHVNYIDNPAYAPFLVTTNKGSALCLACHNK